MSNFNTDDDYGMPVNYDHPEYGDGSRYGKIKKNPFEKLFSSLGSIGGALTLEKVLLILYVIALAVILFNLGTVLDFLFYATMSVLQYIIYIAVFIFLGFCVYKICFRR